MFRGGSGTGLGTETRTGEWCLVIGDLKVATDGLLTTWDGRWFHSGIVRGKNECLNMSVLVWYA